MIFFQSLTQSELADLLRPIGRAKIERHAASPEDAEKKIAQRARYRAKQIFHWVYQRFTFDWDQMTDLSKELREWLKENIEVYRPPALERRQAADGTVKFLWELTDRKTVESVVIPVAARELELDSETPPETQSELPDNAEWSRLTACISSQVGCAMGCKFCLTGIQGLDRNLEVHEIIAQVLEMRVLAPLTNIVFMGMGEPLHNLENVIKASQILLDQDGLNFSKRKVTVSTSGLVPAIEELGRRIDISLAISLNATTDEQRTEIMPVNKKWNIEALMAACRKFPLGSHRRITFEYVLLGGFNDSLEDAARLTDWIRGIPCKINLIPFNEHEGSVYRQPSEQRVTAFQKYLVDHGLTALIRVSRGAEILAACGQLRSLLKLQSV